MIPTPHQHLHNLRQAFKFFEISGWSAPDLFDAVLGR